MQPRQRRLPDLILEVIRTIMSTIMSTLSGEVTEVGLMAARAKLAGLNRELRKRPGTVVRITHRGKPAMTLMSSDLYDAIVETLEVMSDPGAVEALRKSLEDIEAGRVHTLADVAKRLGLER